jgi:hypothetical protein
MVPEANRSRAIDEELSRSAKKLTELWQRRTDSPDTLVDDSPELDHRPPSNPAWDNKKFAIVNSVTSDHNILPTLHPGPVDQRSDFTADAPPNENDDDIQGNINELIAEQLANHRSRGKDSSNVCPLKDECNKNGIDKFGNLIVFTRNSAFRSVKSQHANLH